MDDDLRREVEEVFDEVDPIGAKMRANGFREVLPGDDDWVEVAEFSDPIRLVKRPTH